MKKRSMAIVLALVITLCLLPSAALAAEDEFVIEGSVLKKYKGVGGDVVIPNGVTSIGQYAFRECRSMTSVTIPNSVTSIETDAFAACTNLTSVTIGTSVTSIGQWAFRNCTSLTSLDIPNSVSTIGNYAFNSCTKLVSVTIPNSVTSIGEWVFSDCTSLVSVTIPGSVTKIGERTFSKCTNLTNVVFLPGVEHIDHFVFSGCTNLTSVTLPKSVASIDYQVFAGCSKLSDVYYEGTKEEWSHINISSDNDGLLYYVATIHCNSTGPSFTATPTNDKLTADGVEQSATVYKINGSNYFKIRDLATVLNGTGKQFEVGYDKTAKSVTATTGKGYTKGSDDLVGAASSNEAATISNDTIYVDGVKIQAEVYKIAGNNYFKLRDLGRALDFYVGYEKGKGMFIDTTKPYTE